MGRLHRFREVQADMGRRSGGADLVASTDGERLASGLVSDRERGLGLLVASHVVRRRVVRCVRASDLAAAAALGRAHSMALASAIETAAGTLPRVRLRPLRQHHRRLPRVRRQGDSGSGDPMMRRAGSTSVLQRTTAWICLAACLALAALTVASTWANCTIWGSYSLMLCLGHGGVRAYWATDSTLIIPLLSLPHDGRVRPPAVRIYWTGFRFYPWPGLHSAQGSRDLFVPFWIPLAALAVPSVLIWRGSQRTRIAEPCPWCAYDLTGNTTGICPECGRQVAP